MTNQRVVGNPVAAATVCGDGNRFGTGHKMDVIVDMFYLTAVWCEITPSPPETSRIAHVNFIVTTS